jgi:uncharacterized SAM-binding protein YcdF (DUF218 family)
LTALSVAGLLAGAAGFLAFAEAVRSLEPVPDPRAEAIVVLTGDEERIATGMRLMVEGRAQRLLISGVHPTTRVPTELKRRIHADDATRKAILRCCVDLGHDALNTSGNADEARRWAQSNGFRSMIVVTSGYHMLRSLVEFGRVMPDIRFVSYPVQTSRSLHLESWWRHWPTFRLLLGEYVKLLGSSARATLMHLVAPAAPALRAPLPSGSLPSVSAIPGSDR